MGISRDIGHILGAMAIFAVTFVVAGFVAIVVGVVFFIATGGIDNIDTSGDPAGIWVNPWAGRVTLALVIAAPLVAATGAAVVFIHMIIRQTRPLATRADEATLALVAVTVPFIAGVLFTLRFLSSF